MGDTGESGANKRRRTNCSHDGKCILDLHNGTLAHISSYLHVPSRALFALALTTDASSWRNINWDNRSRRCAGSILSWVKVAGRTTKRQPSEATTAIISGQPKQSWECIDFGEVETSLAIKLDDNDIAGVLACIDGVSNLKVLKITNCYNVKGRGLQQLSASKVLERIDLSIVKMHDYPYAWSYDHPRKHMLSEETVLSILNWIIDTACNSLRHLVLPKNWCSTESEELNSFFEKYNKYLESRMIPCSNCNVTISPDGSANYMLWVNHYREDDSDDDSLFGTQNNTCNRCFQFFCYECEVEGGEDPMLGKCSECNREYCGGCMTWCQECGKRLCIECCEEWCARCGSAFCGTCNYAFARCECCTEMICQNCDSLHLCDFCDGGECHACVVKKRINQFHDNIANAKGQAKTKVQTDAKEKLTSLKQQWERVTSQGLWVSEGLRGELDLLCKGCEVNVCTTCEEFF